MKYDIVKLMARRKIRWKKRWVSGDSGGRLTFRSKKAGRLSDYRIYGNTVDGESVGDLVESGEHAGEYKVAVTVEGKNLSEVNEFSNSITDTSDKLQIWVQQGKDQSFEYPANSNIFVITEPTTITTRITITNGHDSIRIKHNGSICDIVIDVVRGLSPGAYSVSFNVLNYDHTTVGGLVINNIMVNKGSTPLPYEPYHAPVTTPIYLPESIKMVGDEAEYIDYAEQKMHRIGADDIDVTLPALPVLPGTNVLSVGTAVQPSKIEVKGKIKAL